MLCSWGQKIDTSSGRGRVASSQRDPVTRKRGRNTDGDGGGFGEIVKRVGWREREKKNINGE